jgi:hypothetical protein
MVEQTKQTQAVVALVRDLFFSVKLGKELRAHGYRPLLVKTLDEFAARLHDADAVLGILEIDAVDDWEQVARLTGGADAGRIPLLAFGPHKDVAGRRAAQAAGISRVLSNSQLHAEAPRYVARYARERR